MLNLEQYSFPVEGIEDKDVVEGLQLQQPLPTITFKAPQLLVYYFGEEHRRFIMSFDKGMGKTIAYLSILYRLRPRKMVIVCTNNSKLSQRREIINHLSDWCDDWVFVEGQRAKRKKAWESDNIVYICTYATLLSDMGHHAKSRGRICPDWVDQRDTPMAFDEWHKALRNKSSATFKMLKQFDNERMVFSSGSAAGKGVQDQWAVLHLCDRKKFNGYWPFVQRHAIVEETHFGKKIYGCQNVQKWRDVVRPYIFHRKKDSTNYPPKTRQHLEVRMEPWQKKAHDQLRNDLLTQLPDGQYYAASNTLEALTRIRQFMACPKFLSPSFGWGAGLESILADTQDSELSHFVVSVFHTGPIPLIQEFFKQNKVPSERLMGGDGINTADELERRIARWTKNGGAMIQSIKFAESYEMPAARHMYMLSYSHSPDENSQAEDRLVRDISITPHPVDIYYTKHQYSYDEEILDALIQTSDQAYEMMDRPLKELLT
jgi:hypothetical protein